MFHAFLSLLFSHKISDSKPRICQNDASKLAPSLHARAPASTAFPPNCRSNYRYGVTKSLWKSLNKSTLANVNLSMFFNIFQKLNSRYGVNKSLWESHNKSTLADPFGRYPLWLTLE
jgi:hypothetical protein